jgi:pilus assembly protein CpaC
MTITSVIRRSAFIVLLALATPSGLVEATATRADEVGSVRLLVGRSAIVDTGSPIARISLTSSEIADAMVTQPNQLLVQGKLPGTITMFVWNRAGAMSRYDVVVERDLSVLTQHMRELFPGEQINVASNGKSVVISGRISSKLLSEKATEVAAGHVDKKEDVVNMLQVNEAPPPQVLLRVRFAEVNRSAMTELGASLFTSPLGINNTIGRVTTQQFTSPGFDKLEYTKEGSDWGDPVTSSKGEFTFSDFLNVFLFNKTYDLGVMVKALQSRGMFQSLAEPNLVAESGKEASFLAGGEFPIPVAQGSGANLAISVIFKEFGVRLNFTPTVTADGRVRLKVRPEVSTLDFANAVQLQGFRIPALSTRRTETELELDNGQTFAIAGLLNNSMTESLQKVPGIGDIPILGYLFRSKAAQKNRTELVVMITPEILPSGSPGVTTESPRLQEPYLPPLPVDRSFPTPGPAFTPQSDNPALVPKPRGEANAAPAVRPATATPVATGTPNPEAAAAVLRAGMPKGPTMMTLETAPAAAPTELAVPATTAAPAAFVADPITTPQEMFDAPASEPEVRALTREERRQLEKAEEEDRKAEERRRKEAEKAAKDAQKQAEKEAKEARKAAERAQKEKSEG